jgi:hypothetical protein
MTASVYAVDPAGTSRQDSAKARDGLPRAVHVRTPSLAAAAARSWRCRLARRL